MQNQNQLFNLRNMVLFRNKLTYKTFGNIRDLANKSHSQGSGIVEDTYCINSRQNENSKFLKF